LTFESSKLLAQQFKNSNIDLIIKKIDNKLATIGDVYKLEQVIINLLSNAKDAVLERVTNDSDDNQMVITVYAERKNNYIEIIVEDNGIGIRPDHIEKVLNPFFTTKDAGKGTGLGLSISYGIVQEMKGDIRFYSNKTCTQAIVTLPLIS
jgi:signal transduction histidine kinase